MNNKYLTDPKNQFKDKVIVITGSILGIHSINEATGGENWFGKSKNEEESKR